MADNDRSFHVEHTTLETIGQCPICGSEHNASALLVRDHFLSQEEFTLSDCGGCGFRFTNPRPEQSDIGAYYQSDDYLSHSNRKAGVFDRIYQLARHVALRGKYRLIKAQQPGGRVLDIGCGTGEFLAYLMGRGYQAMGVEPEIKAREQAIANHSISVVASINDITMREHFQVITMWHVLEHIPDLHFTLKRIHTLLSDDGLLLIAVPDRESWDSDHYGAQWAAWDVPRHLSHFRRQDVQRLMREHGFQLMPVKRMWLDAFYIALLSERYRGAGVIAASVKALACGTWSNLQALLGIRPTSSSIFLSKKTEVGQGPFQQH